MFCWRRGKIWRWRMRLSYMLTEFAGCYLMDSLISLFSSISEVSLSLSNSCLILSHLARHAYRWLDWLACYFLEFVDWSLENESQLTWNMCFPYYYCCCFLQSQKRFMIQLFHWCSILASPFGFSTWWS